MCVRLGKHSKPKHPPIKGILPKTSEHVHDKSYKFPYSYAH